MKAYIFIIVALLATGVLASICSDTDNGPSSASRPDEYSLGTKGTVRYGLQDKDDVCVLSKSNDLSQTSSDYLKEYFCDGDTLEHEVYECARYGFSGCENGRCVGKDVSNTSSSSSASTVPVSKCGNRIVDSGEECDPPGAVCFGADMSEYGQCTDACTCKLANAIHTKCGNGEIDEGETCESDSDCESWEHCKNCLCVAKPVDNTTDTASSSEDTTVSKTTSSESKKDTSEISDEIDKKYPTPEIHPIEDVEGTNFTADPGIKTTGSIAKFFIGIWDWFAGLFS